MISSRIFITFDEEVDGCVIFFKFSTKSQNLMLLFQLGISKLEEPSEHLKSLKRKKKKEGFVSLGIFLRLKETLASIFVFLEHLIQFQNKTREFITDYCDDTLIRVNYRVLKCLLITMSLLI